MNTSTQPPPPERVGWTENELRDALDRYEAELRAAGKARNTVATYVQHPQRFIDWLVGRYRPTPLRGPTATDEQSWFDDMSSALTWRSKYRPLMDFLAAQTEPVVRMTFVAIEQVLGTTLPPSARNHRAWWANEREGTHVHARAWLDAARRTANVDLNAQTVEFVCL